MEQTDTPAADRQSTTDRVSDEMLNRIRRGEWAVGAAIPSERALMEEFGVSRIALREAMSRLRALGVLDVSQGRKTTVAKLDSSLLGRLFPLMLSMEGDQSFRHVFQVRLALEAQTAHLAAQARTDEDVTALRGIVAEMVTPSERALEDAVDLDLAFHMQIARATGNPLFPALLEALSGFVTYAQVWSCKDDPKRREMANYFHQSILEAIADRDAERARVEMESHLRSSAGEVLKREARP